MSSSSFRSGNCSRPGFFDPSSSLLSRRGVRGVGVPLGVPLGVPPPYDGTFGGGGGGVGVPLGVPPPYDGTVVGGGSGGGSRRRHHELIAQMHGREFSFTHTVFVVVALLLFCVYFVAFIDRMRLNAINATAAAR